MMNAVYGNSLTEVNAISGTVVRVVSGSDYRFNWPDALTVAGKDLWVANEKGNSLTEVSATTGKLVRVVSGSK